MVPKDWKKNQHLIVLQTALVVELNMEEIDFYSLPSYVYNITYCGIYFKRYKSAICYLLTYISGLCYLNN